MLRKMPFILLSLLIVIPILYPLMTLEIKQILYTISLLIKSLIMFLLPFIIFGLLFKSAVFLSGSATRIICIILLLVCCSNFISTFISQYVGKWIYTFNLSTLIPKQNNILKPLYSFNIPIIIKNDIAMMCGILAGLILPRFSLSRSRAFALIIEKFVNQILRCIIYSVPLFVSGFLVKMQFDGSMKLIIKDYAVIMLVIAIAQFSYVILLYFIFSEKNKFLLSIKNMLPAAISAFSTMSSAASMPLSIIGAEKNVKNKELAQSVIPATVNIHLIGDCFAIPIMAYAILKSFGMPDPSLTNYLIFAFYFVIAKFSVAAIPGGGIIVMLPIIQKYLHFTPDMSSLITALYILFDSVITCINVLGNGAFVKIVDKICIRL